MKLSGVELPSSRKFGFFFTGVFALAGAYFSYENASNLALAFWSVAVAFLVVNTSFNVRGEPIVCSPTDAFKCFMGTELDALAAGNYVLIKEEQDESLKENYVDRYELD